MSSHWNLSEWTLQLGRKPHMAWGDAQNQTYFWGENESAELGNFPWYRCTPVDTGLWKAPTLRRERDSWQWRPTGQAEGVPEGLTPPWGFQTHPARGPTGLSAANTTPALEDRVQIPAGLGRGEGATLFQSQLPPEQSVGGGCTPVGLPSSQGQSRH